MSVPEAAPVQQGLLVEQQVLDAAPAVVLLARVWIVPVTAAEYK